MNGNDLFTALSGLDPKYIDEAAFELKKESTLTRQSKTVSFRKIMYIAVPSAAAMLLILAVSFPAMFRVSKSESATSAPSEAPSFDAAAEAPQAEAADEAATEAADDEALNYDAAKTETYNIQSERSDAAKAQAIAVYDNGILTVETPGTVIYDMNSTYSILTSDATGIQTLQEGILKDIATGSDPLTLDISEFDLGKGNYTLKIGDETIDFTI
ncbi:MAG: hypothetical protein J5910_08865 [Lachnospiraceae bacterium]|nr:hypothetical protein [Lachnospiraceae bacterium]